MEIAMQKKRERAEATRVEKKTSHFPHYQRFQEDLSRRNVHHDTTGRLLPSRTQNAVRLNEVGRREAASGPWAESGPRGSSLHLQRVHVTHDGSGRYDDMCRDHTIRTKSHNGAPGHEAFEAPGLLETGPSKLTAIDSAS